MLDSGALTTGTVEAGDAHDRGALLAVHSMIGFGGGALGGPLLAVLDRTGGVGAIDAWFYAVWQWVQGQQLYFLCSGTSGVKHPTISLRE